MIISEKPPPNFADIKAVFPEVDQNLDTIKPIFTWGNTIHNPYKAKITSDLEAHEEVHERQQGMYPEVWWFKYLSDEEFRLEQETEAYGTQYAFVKKQLEESDIPNMKLLEWMKDKMAEALSGQLYGNMLSYGEAESKIRHFAKNL